MKKLGALTLALFLAYSNAMAASAKDITQRVHESFEDSLFIRSINITLNRDAANIITTVTVPMDAKGFRIYPSSTGIRFAVGIPDNSTPALAAIAVSTSPLTAEISSTTLAVGGIAIASIWETRLLPFTGQLRKLYLRAPTAGAVLDLEFFK